MKKISIVLPIYNEEKNIPIVYHELLSVLTPLKEFAYEIILVNDGSRDASWQTILNLAKGDSCIKALTFSRNFGHQIALTAGYDHATGDVIVSMDADLQDPPSLIPSMLEAWHKGADIVYARRADRKDNFLKRMTAILYYKCLSHISDVTIPRNVGDFRLIDKKVLTYLKQCREKSRYLRGMVAWSGFNHAFVDFNRPNRLEGTTGYTWSKMIKLAFDGVTGFSLFPLKLAAFIGVFVILTGCLMFTYISCDALFNKVNYPLFKWLVTIVYIFMGVQFLLMWLIGEYIGRIFEQQKGRPLYIVDKKVNFQESSP
ncbi:MAG: glycosyltransferase family 2 protein [Candidatus Babeliales bacterium]